MPQVVLSVVMPHYHHGAFVGRAVAALQAQERRPDEIIIVDDGSTDGSVSVIEHLIDREPTIRLIRNDQNLGVNASIRRGVDAARGTFLFMASADDEVLPGLFRDSIEMLERYPQAALCSGHCLQVNADRGVIGLMKIPKVAREPSYIPARDVRRLMLRHGNWIVSGTTVYRRERWLDAGGVRSELEGFGDEFLVTVLAMRHGACFVPKPFLAWRRVDTSYAARLNTDQARVQAIADASERLMRHEFAGTFPPGYAGRWRARWLFGARNFALKQAYGAGGQAGPKRLRALAASIVYRIRSLGLFIQMRPADLWSTAWRWLSYR